MKKITFLIVLTLGLLAINNLSAQTLEAHFKFDGNLNDESTNDYTLSATNAPNLEYVTGADGTSNGAVSGFGTADYLETTANIGITGNASRTVTAWIKTDAVLNASGNNRGIVNMGHRAAQKKFTLLLNSNVVRNDIRGGGGNTGVQAIFDDAWHLLAVVFNKDVGTNGTSTIYVDGVSQKVIDWAATNGGVVLNTSARPLMIGNDVFDDNNPPRKRGFEGAIDDVRVYSGTLTQPEIAALYDVGDFWTGATSSDWTTATNWDSGVSPTLTLAKDINIPSGLTNYPVLTSGEDLTVDSDTSLRVGGGASLTVDVGASLTVESGATVTLESTSTSYSSLIANTVSNSGTINYERYTNIVGFGSTGDNDLISPPLSGQQFGAFATANTNLAASSSPTTLKAFAPFDNTATAPGAYVNYDTGTNVSTALIAGAGYRAATTDGSVLIFTGAVSTGDVAVPITIGAGSAWNLIGNPYPSYVDFATFFGANKTSFESGTYQAVYGHNGTNYTIWNQATIDDAAITELLAPGQGFFVKAAAAGPVNVNFTAAMRSTGSSDDFIIGKSSSTKTSDIYNVKLQLVSDSKSYKTDFYFTDNASVGLDPGYDATLYSSVAPSFALYSHLVEDNTGKDIGIQSLGISDLESVTIPLGINAASGEEFTLSIASSTLDAGTYVYLKDNVSNELTLLNDTNFSFTPSENLSSTGNFSLVFSGSEVLAVDELNRQNSLEIFTSSSEKVLHINGVLNDVTSVAIYDIQCRRILSETLNQNSSSNRIELSTLKSGIYIVQVSSNNMKQTKKVLIN